MFFFTQNLLCNVLVKMLQGDFTMFQWVLDGYHFLVPIKSGFHKINYKRLGFSFFILKKNIYIRSGYNYFYKKNLIEFHKFENNGYHLLVLKSRFFFSNKKIIIKFTNKFIDYIPFLENKKN